MIDSILIKSFLFTRTEWSDCLLVQKYRISVTLRVKSPGQRCCSGQREKIKPKMVGWRQGRWRVLARSCVCELVLRLCVQARISSFYLSFHVQYLLWFVYATVLYRYRTGTSTLYTAQVLYLYCTDVRNCFSCLANVPSFSLLLFGVRW